MGSLWFSASLQEIGLSLALDKMLINKVLIINDAAFFEDSDDEHSRYPTLEWDIQLMTS